MFFLILITILLIIYMLSFVVAGQEHKKQDMLLWFDRHCRNLIF